MTDLITVDGFHLKRVSATHGGEYAGACPWCGGVDRFRVWPDRDRYWCRQCGNSGDSIQFLRDFRGMSYREACGFLSSMPRTVGSFSQHPGNHRWVPRHTERPNKIWGKSAGAFLDWCQRQLWDTTAGSPIRTWLREIRGLAGNTIGESCLGWCPKNFWREREKWGLDDATSGNYKKRMLFLPKGLVIPYHFDGHICRLRIRRPETENGRRYFLITGCDTRFMILPGKLDAAILVESELDAILIHQEAQDLISPIAIGNSSARPDRDAHEFLTRVKLILISLDTDEAGAKEAWRWWLKKYPHALRWPPVGGKDPGEMFQKGINIREWIMTGVEQYSTNREFNNGEYLTHGN